MKHTKLNPEGFLKVYSRHSTHNALRRAIPTNLDISIRFGSTTNKGGILLNTPETVLKSSDKLEMKKTLTGLKTPNFYHFENGYWYKNNNIIPRTEIDLTIPYLKKLQFRSRGAGMVLLDTPEKVSDMILAIEQKSNSKNKWYLEEYHEVKYEYRVHCSDRVFMNYRKGRRNGNSNDFFRNASNSVFFLQYVNGELSSNFKQPDNWEQIELECLKAKEKIGLDFTAIDVIIDQNNNFYILETNSAPSLGGPIITQAYIDELKRFIEQQ